MDNNVVTQLLALDRSDIVRAKGTHMMALSKLQGQVMTFELQALSAEELCDIQDMSVTVEQASGNMSVHSFAPTCKTIISGCPSVFHNSDVRKHFQCESFNALVNLLLTKDEATELASEIRKLSDGLENDVYDITDKELKNL